MTSGTLRTILIVGAFICAVSLAACATAPIVPPSADVAMYQGTASAETAFAAADTLFAKYRASLPAPTAAKIAGLIKQASAALDDAENAELVGDATTETAQLAAAMGLVSQIKSQLPAK